MTAARLDPLGILGGLVLEDGRTWGEAAEDWQRSDAAALFDRSTGAPRRHWWLRARGMSKSSDAAGATLAALLAEAPERSRSYIFATDTDQAALVSDALVGFVNRTPQLAGALEVGARTITARATGASVSVESSDGASSLGLRPWWIVADELAAWPSSANHRRLWSSLVSATPKVPGSRLLVASTAGSPVGLGARVWQEAERSAHWRTSRTPGPSPWWTSEDVAATRSSLTASEWRRLVECEFAEGDDSLATAEDVEACVRAGSAVLPPQPGHSYTAALDVGTRRDWTALVVAHAERTEAGRVIVVDRVMTWRPEKGEGGRVNLDDVQASVLRVCREYRARLRFDRAQAEQLAANIARAGVRVEEFVFSSSGASKLARSLFVALRDRALSLPDDEATREQFLSVRMIETGPSTVRLSNPANAHDDIPTAVGMALVDLLSKPDTGGGMLTVPTAPRPVARTVHDAVPGMPLAQQLKRAQRDGPRGVPFILAGANDFRRAGLNRGGQPFNRRT